MGGSEQAARAWFLELLDRELATREFIAGDRYTVADITALVTVDFMKPGKPCGAGGAWQRQTLARRGIGAAERAGLTSS